MKITRGARSARGAKTLPREYFVSPGIFVEEAERIFAASWICVGRASRIPNPGNFFLHQSGKESVIVVRDTERKVRAFYNVCRHRGTQLCTESQGNFSGKIQCPYHGWSYAYDGRLLGAPNMSVVQNFSPAEYPLHTVPVAEWEGFVFIRLSQEGDAFETVFASLYDRLGPWRISELEAAHRIVYDVAANWKLIFQNYSECYHCPKVHPALNKLTPYRNTTIYVEDGPILGGPMQMSQNAESMTVDGRACAAPIGDMSGEDRKLVYYYTIFPSLFLSLHPDYVLVHRIEPLSPERTRITCDWLFHPEESQKPNFDPARAVAFWDETNRQDWHVCELSQNGINSRAYTPGPYSDLESLLAAFDRHYLTMMKRPVSHRDTELAG